MYTNVIGNIWKGKYEKKRAEIHMKKKKETKHVKNYMIPQKKQSGPTGLAGGLLCP